MSEDAGVKSSKTEPSGWGYRFTWLDGPETVTLLHGYPAVLASRQDVLPSTGHWIVQDVTWTSNQKRAMALLASTTPCEIELTMDVADELLVHPTRADTTPGKVKLTKDVADELLVDTAQSPRSGSDGSESTHGSEPLPHFFFGHGISGPADATELTRAIEGVLGTAHVTNGAHQISSILAAVPKAGLWRRSELTALRSSGPTGLLSVLDLQVPTVPSREGDYGIASLNYTQLQDMECAEAAKRLVEGPDDDPSIQQARTSLVSQMKKDNFGATLERCVRRLRILSLPHLTVYAWFGPSSDQPDDGWHGEWNRGSYQGVAPLRNLDASRGMCSIPTRSSHLGGLVWRALGRPRSRSTRDSLLTARLNEIGQHVRLCFMHIDTAGLSWNGRLSMHLSRGNDFYSDVDLEGLQRELASIGSAAALAQTALRMSEYRLEHENSFPGRALWLTEFRDLHREVEDLQTRYSDDLNRLAALALGVQTHRQQAQGRALALVSALVLLPTLIIGLYGSNVAEMQNTAYATTPSLLLWICTGSALALILLQSSFGTRSRAALRWIWVPFAVVNLAILAISGKVWLEGVAATLLTIVFTMMSGAVRGRMGATRGD